MKKRAMKKYIPKNTDYCYSIIGGSTDGKRLVIKPCKNRIYRGVKVYKGVYNGESYVERIPTYKCRYTGISNVNDACFYDRCKCCGVGDNML
ncbi:hypothetical protein [Alkaliphilus sp. B6464]|uniref:hypothetical protein n=1 Tax=Alkaliphilus sp. B6464 TaxID=2731219 RepID=UPI001BAA45CF|nr:hypothetical protein [Alkaliphilus sp. B6464]QUH21804.1 hypothetical protein HYG84_17870 [Alkaliphilus sp. B6464]